VLQGVGVGNGRVGPVGQMPPVARGRVQAGQHSDLHRQARGADDAQQADPQMGVAHVGGGYRGPVAGLPVVQRHGHHPGAGIDGRLEQGAVEGQQLVAVGSGAFGEDTDPMAPPQFLDQVLPRPLGGCARAPFQEDGFGADAEPADHRPAADVVLGDEGGGGDGIDGEDVQPGNVVGHEQAAIEGRAGGQQAHAQGVQELPRPAGLQGQPRRPGQPGKGESHRRQAPQQVQGRAGEAEGGADFDEDSVQFWRSTKCRW